MLGLALTACSALPDRKCWSANALLQKKLQIKGSTPFFYMVVTRVKLFFFFLANIK